MRKIFFGLFFAYCALLVWILLLSREADRSLGIAEYFAMHANVYPYRTLIRYISYFAARRDRESLLLLLTNIGGNFLLFLPMGLFLPVLFSGMRRYSRCMAVVFAAILSAELLQGVLRVGVPDIDDLTMNMMGALAGLPVTKNFSFAESSYHKTSLCRIHFCKK